MKKIVFVAFVCLMTCTTYAQPEPQQQSIEPVLPSIPDGYVDLGLPSGTLWKDKNESGFYSYDQAVSQFGSSLPSQGQWEELRSLCGWTWTGNGYKVIGPSGASIVLPAAGFRYCNETVHDIGKHLFMDLAAPAVSLDKVTHLEGHFGVFGDKARSPFEKLRAALPPHLSIPCKLCPLNAVEPLYLFVVIGMIDTCRLGVKMGVAKYYNGIISSASF